MSKFVVLFVIYNFVNWSRSWFGLVGEIQGPNVGHLELFCS